MSEKLYVVKAFVDEIESPIDLTKYTNNKFKAKQIQKKLKDAAEVLGLGDKFLCALEEENIVKTNIQE